MLISWRVLLGLVLNLTCVFSEDGCLEGSTCIPQRKCPNPQKELKDGNQVVTTCNLPEVGAAVCCITGSEAGTKSREKCEEYGRSVGEAQCVSDSDDIREKRLITHGKPAKPKEFPHMALIGRIYNGSLQWHCGGSLIAEQYVLSAAHCTKAYGDDWKAKWVRLGEYNVKSEEDQNNHLSSPRDFDIVEWYDHPGYDDTGDGINDITIYKLVEPVNITEFVRPICLNSQAELTYTQAIATGWGFTEHRNTSDVLLKVDLSIVQCSEEYDKNEIICASNFPEMKDTCRGDSGGPLQVRMDEPRCMFLELGVTSFGPRNCGYDFPGGYMRVSYFLPWIESIVWP